MRKDCNPRWTTCPLAKRVWLQNNPGIVRKLKKEAMRERGYFDRYRPTLTAYSNDKLLPIARKALEAGLYSTKTAVRDIAWSLDRHITQIFGIRRQWLKDGWKNSEPLYRFKRDRGLRV